MNTPLFCIYSFIRVNTTRKKTRVIETHCRMTLLIHFYLTSNQHSQSTKSPITLVMISSLGYSFHYSSVNE